MLVNERFSGSCYRAQTLASILAKSPEILEAQVVGIADDITYINHDYDDFAAFGLPISESLREAVKALGVNREERTNKAIRDILDSSNDDKVDMSRELKGIISNIKEQEYEIYRSHEMWTRKEEGAREVIFKLLDYFINTERDHISDMINSITGTPPKDVSLFHRWDETTREQAVIEYLAKMTDTFALEQYEAIYSPQTKRYYF